MARLFNIFAILAVTLLFACGYKTTSPYTLINGTTQGTTYSIKYQDSLKRDLTDDVERFLSEFDNTFSIYNPNSTLSLINRNEPYGELSSWFVECFELSRRIFDQTHGYFDPTLRVLTLAYGFGEREVINYPSREEIDSLMKLVGYDKVEIQNGVLIKNDSRIELDYNAVAKGYSVDLLGRMMDSLGIKNYLIEIGGEILARGVNSEGDSWRVAIDTPVDGNIYPGKDLQAIISLNEQALATSGNYRKFFITEKGEKIVHTINPKDGLPAINSLLSATIVAPDCGLADGFATACMVVGVDGSIELLKQNPELAGLLLYKDKKGEITSYYTPNMLGRIRFL